MNLVRPSSRPAPTVAVRIPALLALALAAVLPGTADAQSFGLSSCMGISNCTSNDLTFSSVGLGIVDDGCVSPDDTITIFLKTVIRNLNAQDRYDVGMFYSASGVDAQTDPQCYRAILAPAGADNDRTCTSNGGSLDLLGGSGPYLSIDGLSGQTPAYDGCGDITDANNGGTGCDDDNDGLWDDTVVRFDDISQAMTFPCRDNPVSPNGFVNIATCLSWAANPTVLGTGNPTLCSSIADIEPGTSAKCQCDGATPTDIPAPSLGLSCTSVDPPDGVAAPGESVIREITYTNSCTCTPGSEPEAEQCCTVSSLRIPITYDSAAGSVVPDSISATRGSFSDDGAGTILWTPASAAAGTPGIIGPGDTATLSYRYTVSESATDGTIAFGAGAQWARDAAGTGGWKPQSVLDVTCPVEVSTTWTTVSDLAARVAGERAVVEWSTAAEAGTVGFHLERSDAPDRPPIRVTDDALPATGAVAGGVYRYIDTGVPAGSAPVYRLIELDVAGRELVRSKVAATAAGSAPAVDRGAPGFVRRRSPATRRLPAETDGTDSSGDATPWRSGGVRLPGIARARLDVAVGGVHRVDADRIAAALSISRSRFAAAVRSGRVRIEGPSGEVPWTAAGDDVLFVGVPQVMPFGDVAVYWLELADGERMAQSSLPPAGTGSPIERFPAEMDLEPDRVAYPYFASSADDDIWFWAAIMSHSPPADTASAEFDLPGAVTDADDIRIRLRLRQVTDLPGSPDVRATILLNDIAIGIVESDLPGDAVLTAVAPSTVLNDGRNEIRVEGEIGTFLLGGFTLEYPRRPEASGDRLEIALAAGDVVRVTGFSTPDLVVIDVSDPLRPLVVPDPTSEPDGVGGWGFTAATDVDRKLLVAAPSALPSPVAIAGDRPSDLFSSAHRADWLAIAPEDLIGTAERLAAHRSGLGWTTMVVDVRDVWDEFGGGARDPRAIRDLLRHAVASWETPPRAVLLVGGGTYDLHDRGDGGNLIPPAMVLTAHGAVPSDSILGDVDDDGVPEISVGRIPVQSRDELSAYVDRLVATETGSDRAWRSRIVIAADDPDPSGDFAAAADLLAAAVPAGVPIDEIRLGGSTTSVEARSQLVRAIDDGVGLVTWIGHAGVTQLASEGILRARDVRGLTNVARLPVVAALTCSVNQFADPATASLGEELVLHTQGGAAAVFSASGPSATRRSTAVGEALHRELLAPGVTDLGDAILRATEAAVAAGTPPSALEMFTLLGDPGHAVGWPTD